MTSEPEGPQEGRRGWVAPGTALRRVVLGGVGLAAAVGAGLAWRGAPAAGPGAGTEGAPVAGGNAGSAVTTTAPAGVADGARLFQLKGCAQCHVAMAPTFPDLSDAATWAGERVEGMTAEEYLAESILDPAAVTSPQVERVGGPDMPRLNVTDEEVDALVAYLLGD